MSLSPSADGFVNLLRDIQSRGLDASIADMVRQSGDVSSRRKVALFIGGLRGHRIDVEHLVEQPYGYVGQCSRCSMMLKVPRVMIPGGAGVEGRATEFTCPSGSK